MRFIKKYEGKIKSKICLKREKGGKDIRTRRQSVVDDKLLIDLPADTYLHTFQGLDITSIRHCLITYLHQDHLYAEELGMRRKGFAHFENENVLTMYAGVMDVIRFGQALQIRLRQERRCS